MMPIRPKENTNPSIWRSRRSLGALAGLSMVAIAAATFGLGPTERAASLMAGTSAVAAEALSFGRAVIASDVGGLREQVIDGITGIKVPPEDVAALVAAIRDLLRDEGRRRDMEAAALKRAAELSWDRFAYETVTVYRKTLQRS